MFRHFINLKTAKAQKIVFFIGKTGPAGGILFYDKGEYSDGWRYLEAAPTDMETALRWVAASYGDNSQSFPNVTGTGTAIGTGKNNTSIIRSTIANTPAADACVSYIVTGFESINDWFLPSLDELILLSDYINLTTLYWSSSRLNIQNDEVYAVSSSSSNYFGWPRLNLNRVRPIRAF